MKNAIVLEGGGVLGACQPALLKALEDRGRFNLNRYNIFVGTSVGGVNALALACGFTLTELCELWLDIREAEIMPKKWWSLVRGMRTNKVGEFVRERVLKPKGFHPEITAQQLFNETGKEYYTVATVLQTNRGLIFGHDWHNIPVADAAKFTVSHPLSFDPNQFVLNGQTLDLTDGGVIQNCPVTVLIPRRDIAEVLCISVTSPGEETTERITGYVEVLKHILKGMVTRNEVVSYRLADEQWGENFKLWDCKFRKDYDIFDVSAIPEIIREAGVVGQIGEPKSLSMWIPPVAKTTFVDNKVLPMGIEEGALLRAFHDSKEKRKLAN